MATANDVHYRLGLDVGTNSIGWAAVELDDDDNPCGILRMGVRYFPDGRARSRDKQSNAVKRRAARGQRRNRDRYLKRRDDLMRALIQFGLMPHDERARKALEQRDPYAIRARALDDRLEPHELGRAIFHLNQRRGFKSNRKAEKPDSKTGPIRTAVKELSQQISVSNARTLGEFLYRRRSKKDPDPVRFRNLGTEKQAKYEIYPTREMVLAEFDAIWESQTLHYPNILTVDVRESLRGIISHQRSFVQGSLVGKCSLDPAHDSEDTEGLRCPWAHPLAQRFRIWQEVRNLEVYETGVARRRLSKAEGDKVAETLLKQKNVSFDRIRKLIDLPSDRHFNLEGPKRKYLLGDETTAKMANQHLFGKTWRNLPLNSQIEIIERLLAEENEAAATKWLEQHYDLSPQAAERVVSESPPVGHCRLGLRAIKRILPYMEGGLNYPEAAKAAGYDHARILTGELSLTGSLPYYGELMKDHLHGSGNPEDPDEKRWGRFPNPTVHIGLGQLRRVVNSLIDEYGRPQQVVVEMTREFKLSGKKRLDLETEQATNQKKNEERNKKLKDLGVTANYKNRLKLRLWEDLNPENPLDRRCPYTGKVISCAKLFTDEVEIDHLIPFQDSYDDSPSNKIVCFRSANRRKGMQTPHEAFGSTSEWEDISKRASKLPQNKRWRFQPDAREHFDEEGGFLSRQLNETGWLARMSKEYLKAVVSPNDIWVIPGRLTSMIRSKWGLNNLLPGNYTSDAKNRTDHRHHAIDALVVALTDRSLLQRISSSYDETRSRIKVPQPWDGFHNQLKHFLDDIVVSYKPDHGTRGVEGKTTGQLHKATPYGLSEPLGDGDDGQYNVGRYNVVVRKELSEFKKRSDLDAVRGPAMQNALQELWDKVKGEPTKFAEQAANKGVPMPNGARYKVRRVRVDEEQRVIPIVDKKTGKYYKGYPPGKNEFADIWMLRNGTWQMVVVATFDANQPGFDIERFRPKDKKTGKPDPVAKRLMRLHIDDMGALGRGAERSIVRVRKISGGQVWLDDHNEADVDARITKARELRKKGLDHEGIREQKYSARQLKQQGFRKVGVDEIGRVRDPGPRS